jgi:hypothetical protein
VGRAPRCIVAVSQSRKSASLPKADGRNGADEMPGVLKKFILR